MHAYMYRRESSIWERHSSMNNFPESLIESLVCTVHRTLAVAEILLRLVVSSLRKLVASETCRKRDWVLLLPPEETNNKHAHRTGDHLPIYCFTTFCTPLLSFTRTKLLPHLSCPSRSKQATSRKEKAELSTKNILLCIYFLGRHWTVHGFRRMCPAARD